MRRTRCNVAGLEKEGPCEKECGIFRNREWPGSKETVLSPTTTRN